MEERSFDELIDATCPSCRHAVPMDASVCPNCGYRLKAEVKKAPATAKAAAEVTKSAARKSSNAHVWGGIILMAILLIILIVASVI